MGLAGNKNLSYKASALKTASAIIHTGKINFKGLLLVGDETNSVTVEVFDGTDDTGDAIVPAVIIDSSTNNTLSLFTPTIICSTGIYVKVTTSGTCSYTVYYNKDIL